VYLQLPLGLHAGQHIVKLNQPVHHRVLGVILVATSIRQKQRHPIFDGYVGLKLMDERFKVPIGPARLLCSGETVENEQRRAVRANFLPQQIDKSLEAVFLKDAEAVHIDKSVGNTPLVKEPHRLHVLHHAIVRFCQ
jgi:hypothetical protein